jgi:membrane associated rhomboid family serine protease
MRSAAVGFQCPNCVAEGSKQTRSGRTAYGGLRSENPILTSIVLIGINAAVWLAVVATGGNNSRLVDWIALRPQSLCTSRDGSQWFPTIDAGSQCDRVAGTWYPGVADAPWQLLTSAFTHISPIHIALNMLGLYLFGPVIEAAIGRGRFLAVYLLSGLAGSAMVYWLSAEHGSTLGASGAIYGLLGAALVLAYKVRGYVQGILLLLAINTIYTFTGPGNISWQGHLGGLVGGLVLMLLIAYSPRERRTFWQFSGFAVLTVLLAAAIVARTLALA